MTSRTNKANNADRTKAISGMESSAETMKTSRQRSLRLERDKTSLPSIESRSLKLRENATIADANNGGKSEELVKYMSNLPVYLQRAEVGDNIQGKALNFGVLDWGRLEKWKSEQRSGPLEGGSASSASSSRASLRGGNANSASSSQSSPSSTTTTARGEDVANGSSSQRRKTSTLKDHLTKPAKEGRAPASDRRTMPPKTVMKPSGKDRLEIKLENGARETLNSKFVSRNEEKPSKPRSSSNSEDPVKEKRKARGGEFKSRAEPSVEQSRSPLNSGFEGRHDPRSSISARSREEAKLECSTTDYGRTVEAKRHSFTDDFDFLSAELCSDIPYSCPLPCELQGSKWPDIDLSTPVGVEVVRILSNNRCSFSNSDEKQTAQSKDEDEDELQNESLSESLKQRIAESAVVPSAKLTAGCDRLSGSFNSVQTPTARSSNTTTHCDKNGFSAIDSHRSKPNVTGRSRQSPLRRIIEQVLKPKSSRLDELPTNGSKFGDAKELRPEDRPVPALGLRKSFTSSQSLKRNLNLTTGIPDEKGNKSTMNALVEITDNGGLPLLTFIPDEGTDILAAKMRKILASGKDDDFEWIYTFYTVREVKKKGVGWINQGRKDRKYVPNIVGQMKISASQCPKLNGKDSQAVVWTKEFVLFGAELGEAAHEALDFLPNNELAAIIITSQKPRPQNTHDSDVTECQKPPSITVIIPNGVHSLPASEGVPAPLIDRWRSGGSCDCGGWDVGCTLAALTNDACQSSSLPHASLTPEDTRLADLFVQGGPPETRHAFSLAAFKEDLYSAEFSAFISPVQAFSICVAILHDQKPVSLPEVCHPVEKVSVEAVVTERAEKTAQSLGEAPGRYVPYPPHSPVGRA
ncbi:uncharacterized protein [Aristolochia californica]|uniref:uncharacterized protein n=1 Tax=Aristolochia californica TaxID=171875 RepID=UPI0035D5BD0A